MKADENSNRERRLDERGLVDKITYALFAASAVLLLIDLLDVFDVMYHKHTHFDLEKWFGFYAIFGFVASVALVVVARMLRFVLKREEDYYD